jgi:hypothetical protein
VPAFDGPAPPAGFFIIGYEDEITEASDDSGEPVHGLAGAVPYSGQTHQGGARRPVREKDEPNRDQMTQSRRGDGLGSNLVTRGNIRGLVISK